MIKVYKPMFGGKNTRRARIYGGDAEIWAELTCAMSAVFHAASRVKGRKKAKGMLMVAIAQAKSDEPAGEKDGGASE